MNIIFSGVIGRLPVGGHAWIAMQYLAGLRALGHDVFFLEDCGEESWVYDWQSEQLTTDLAYPAGYVEDCLRPLGLDGRWIYRAGEQSRGMSIAEFHAVCERADLLIIWAVPMQVWREEYDLPTRRAYIDADPGFTQISLVNCEPLLMATVQRCERHFTIAQRIGLPGCAIPTAGLQWQKTLPPVSLPHWPFVSTADDGEFTSVMQWRGFHEVSYDGVEYGQKDREFPRFMHIPERTAQPFRIAITGAAPEDLERYGWNAVPGWIPSRTPWTYRDFIQSSRAEFGVAKHGYVLMQGGWFSDRSVCYLASGRPVLVEDTGLGDWLPTGTGVVTFRDVEGAVRGVESICSDYARQRQAARQIAEEIFAADHVLPPLLEAALS